MNPLNYARKGLKQPGPIDHRSPLERKLDRIFLIVVLVILGTLAGLFVLFMVAVIFLGQA